MDLLPNSLCRAARFAIFEGILGFSHLSGGGVNANHNVWTRSPSLARKNKTENGEGNRDVWVEFLSGEGDRHCFILASDKNKKEQKNLLIELVDYSPKQDDHKQRTLQHSI